ncbi:PBSX family phage terminase large subunit [Ligilactobacillus aviarius]|uniref:PBSX family phage terminase large subunit n=1 Tax=Ligilactobacillus aviarius TaxID=1606 RepID=UPI0025A476EA|nr:PBSX family phage terminase large subunit [Ligilactobacillus aviarius]MDM8277838.1 PBSX family phage terminase large subunit [Ligilactobacillus aviarius]
MTINQLYTPKQIKVLQTYLRNDWRIMVNYGAVRAGKTQIDNDLFLLELKRVRKIADELGVDEPMYILAGVSSKTIQNNILQELTNKYGIDFHFDKHGSFTLFGVKCVTAFTGSISGLGAIRGMTAFGAYINEASLANQAVFNEIDSRCSAKGARIICDTNPDNPEHWLKKDYIDNQNDDAKIVSFHFTIDDNTFLTDDYIKSKKASTPSGMFYDRDILGLWVSGEGMVYRDFNKDTMKINRDGVPDELSIYCGVDWGYEHKGSIVVFGDDDQGNTYLLEEHTEQYKEIDYWVNVAKDIQERYGYNVVFWADSARPEHVARFQRENITTYNADKSILSGIESVAKRIKSGHFKVVNGASDKFYDEIYQYIWNESTGLPEKKNDDVMDAMRYAIYNKHKNTEAEFLNSPYI